jgi:hypothetical protein
MVLSARIPAPTEGALTQSQRTDEEIKRTQLRVDVVRNSLGTFAGVGALAALVLAVRRQYQKELIDAENQKNNDRTHEHQERVASDARHDAAERRITELQIKAADQLGNEKGAVRLSGLYALERLAQDNERHRQVVANIICAYLRMPHPAYPDPDFRESPPREADLLAPLSERASEELEVRLAAQRILTDHSQAMQMLDDGQIEPDPLYWPVRLDLSGAVLVNFDARFCTFKFPNFTCAKFHGKADFFRAELGGGADFSSAVFNGETMFAAVTFARLPLFGGTRFAIPPDFGGVYINSFAAGERVALPKGWKLIKDPEGSPRLLMVKSSHPIEAVPNIPPAEPE